MSDHTAVVVSAIPPCDVCGGAAVDRPAVADARLPGYDSWANVCLEHFVAFGCAVGLGQGQQYVQRTANQKEAAHDEGV